MTDTDAAIAHASRSRLSRRERLDMALDVRIELTMPFIGGWVREAIATFSPTPMPRVPVLAPMPDAEADPQGKLPFWV